MQPTAKVVTLLAVVGLALAACGAEDRESIENDGRVGGVNVFNQSDSAAQYVIAYENFKDDVASCMEEQGFELIDIDQELGAGTLFPKEYQDDLASDISDSIFAQKYGFGIATLVLMDLKRSTADSELSEEQLALEEALDEKLPDPDTPEGAAYWEALYGPEKEGAVGCEGKAREKWLSGAIQANLAIQDVRETQRKFAADPRVHEHYKDWSECMSMQGFAYQSPIGAYLDFDRRLEQEFAGTEASGAQLAEEEIAAAEATVACGESPRSLLPVELQVVWGEYVDPSWLE